MALQMLHKETNKPLSLGPRGDSLPRAMSGSGPGPMPVPAPSGPSPTMMGGQVGLSSLQGGPPGMRQDAFHHSQTFGGLNDMGSYDREMDHRNPSANIAAPNRDPRGLSMDDSQRFGGRDPRTRDPRAGGGGDPRVKSENYDPRSANGGASGRGGQGQMSGASSGTPSVGSAGSGPLQLPPHLASADPSRTALIMQVLQLTDEQIAMLPNEQRISIMELKKQINSNHQ